MAMTRSYKQIIRGWCVPVFVSLAGSRSEPKPDDAVKAYQNGDRTKFPGMKVLRVSKTEIPGWLLVETTVTGWKTTCTLHESGQYVLSGGTLRYSNGPKCYARYVRDRQRKALLAGMDTSKPFLLSPIRQLERRCWSLTIRLSVLSAVSSRRVEKLVETVFRWPWFYIPLVRTHPDTFPGKSVAIWCAPDQAEALGRTLKSKPVMGEAGACSHPIGDSIKWENVWGELPPNGVLAKWTIVFAYRLRSEVLACRLRPRGSRSQPVGRILEACHACPGYIRRYITQEFMARLGRWCSYGLCVLLGELRLWSPISDLGLLG